MNKSGKCIFVNSSGKQCGCYAVKNSTFCFNHDPSKSEERTNARRKGGKLHRKQINTVPVENPSDVLRIIEKTIGDVLLLENSPERAQLVSNLSTVALNAMQLMFTK
mgnify:CR=1 FL=1